MNSRVGRSGRIWRGEFHLGGRQVSSYQDVGWALLPVMQNSTGKSAHPTVNSHLPLALPRLGLNLRWQMLACYLEGDCVLQDTARSMLAFI